MLSLSFYGGAQEVTGACYLLETPKTKLLVDCGLMQGSRIIEKQNREAFPFDPKTVDALFVTHAHLDHVGRIPKLVRDGFHGRIISTPPTRDLAELILYDSLGVMEKEARGRDEELFYGEEDVKRALELWEGIAYHTPVAIEDAAVLFRDAGHVLGSGMITVMHETKTIVFTGDLGNPPTPLLSPTEEVSDANILIIESTYGDRLHEHREERKVKLERVIEDTIKRKGVLMIPAFSLERTQELLFEINDLVEHHRIPRVPIYLDSPLAIKATAVYHKYNEYFNKQATYIIRSGDDVFKFPGLAMTLSTEESKAINNVPAPKVIIAGSGMSTGGRILHHERRYLPDPASALLLIGYQTPGSLGRRLQDGARRVQIFGEEVPVRARIETIRGYSAHPDRDGLFAFVERTGDRLERVFVVQGDPQAALFFVQRLRDYLGLDARAPKYKERFTL